MLYGEDWSPWVGHFWPNKTVRILEDSAWPLDIEPGTVYVIPANTELLYTAPGGIDCLLYGLNSKQEDVPSFWHIISPIASKKQFRACSNVLDDLVTHKISASEAMIRLQTAKVNDVWISLWQRWLAMNPLVLMLLQDRYKLWSYAGMNLGTMLMLLNLKDENETASG